MLLLNTTRTFFFLIETRHIWIVTIIFTTLIALLLGSIYIYLYKKKRNFFSNKNIQQKFEEWVSRFLLENIAQEDPTLIIPLYLKKQFKSKNKKQAAINILVQTKRDLVGMGTKGIISIYEQLSFKQFSVNKLKHSFWHIKAKGIQELYIMDQSDMLGTIYRYTNSSNKYVRKEAQTAIIHFLGFNGLHFLNVLSKPISDWEQINLIEQLKQFPFTPIKHLETWLQSRNYTVVLFTLKLIAAYQQFQTYQAVEHCLKHAHEKVRIQAVKTLVNINNEHTANTLVHQYPKETLASKINIIEQLTFIAIHTQQKFFFNCLQEEHVILKLTAAKALEQQGVNVTKLLKGKDSTAKQHFYMHTKTDMSI